MLLFYDLVFLVIAERGPLAGKLYSISKVIFLGKAMQITGFGAFSVISIILSSDISHLALGWGLISMFSFRQ